MTMETFAVSAMHRSLLATFAAAGLAAGSGGAVAAPPATVQAFVILPVTEAAHADFMKTMGNNARNARAEPGNLSFDVLHDEAGGPTVYLVERWQDQAAVDHHLQTPHLQAVLDALPTATDAEPTVIWMDEVPAIPAEPPRADVVAPRTAVVMFEATDATRAAFLDAMAAFVPPARAAPGNLGFDVFQTQDDANRFVLVGRWASTADHEAHLQADHAAEFTRAIDGLLTADPMDHRWFLAEVDIGSG